MDKQKHLKQVRIDEMASIIQCVLVERTDIKYIPDLCVPIAEELMKYYQPKIPENAVVLTGTESFGQIEDLLTEFDEMGFVPTTTCPYPNAYASNWELRLAWAIGQLVNQKVGKFAERLKSECFDGGIDDKWVAVTFSRLDEIAKEITEGDNETKKP